MKSNLWTISTLEFASGSAVKILCYMIVIVCTQLIAALELVRSWRFERTKANFILSKA